MTDETRRDAIHEAMVGHVVGDDRPGSHHRGFPDGHRRQRISAPEPIVTRLVSRWSVLRSNRFGLRASVGCRPRITIVDEHDAVTDEHLAASMVTPSQMNVRRDLAACADDGPLLDLDKGSNPRVLTDRTAIKVHEVRVRNPHAGGELHVCGEWQGFAPFSPSSDLTVRDRLMLSIPRSWLPLTSPPAVTRE